VQTYLNLGMVKEAEQKLTSFREKYPNDGKGILLSAWLSMKQGNVKEALELTNKRLEIDQSDAIAWQLRGQINGIMADYDQAIMDLKRSSLVRLSTNRIALAKIAKVKRIEDLPSNLKVSRTRRMKRGNARNLMSERKESLDDFYATL
jgi:tetratricopeptide (TPR) repeat protein